MKTLTALITAAIMAVPAYAGDYIRPQPPKPMPMPPQASTGNATASALALGVIDFTKSDRPAVGFGLGVYDGDTALGIKGIVPINDNWSATLGIVGDTDGDEVGGAVGAIYSW